MNKKITFYALLFSIIFSSNVLACSKNDFTTLPIGSHDFFGPDTSAGSSYNFHGTSNGSDLYTTKYVTGKSDYTLRLTNNSKNKLSVKAFVIESKSFSISELQVPEVPEGHNSPFIINVKKSDQVYLKFYGPCDFTGSIY